ncbi:hypothetical protein SAMN05216412_101167 [Nitrosospira multiformis]|uniref:Uncharacterized protein n=1 Tax=Nitrosospira multiformis TaxID=1231 RepID=A0A1H9YDF1_9PROT|nr:hypothetical protein SAMN05216412_101167 [Nitrosospira multiformis]
MLFEGANNGIADCSPPVPQDLNYFFMEPRLTPKFSISTSPQKDVGSLLGIGG